MRLAHKKVIFVMVLVFLLASLACNAIALSTKATQTPVGTPTLEAGATSLSSGMVANLDNLEKAVVHIETEGTHRDPSEGLKVDVEGSGTGFIVDASGIAVTNNHVVAGAALLRVWISGENQPRSAIVLGTSECSDLAVIDIDGGGFQYLGWYEGEIKAGLDVYTAGFPISGAGIGYTLTKGIVSKPTGSVNWTVASVNNIIEHTARINPGNSGGPLVTAEAKVVGVNFGFNSTLDQNYAVARDEARPIIDQLRGGVDVNSLGINGLGVQGDLQGNAVVGVWVRSIKAGSPADLTGIRPGDIITQLGDEVLNDGTLGGYCAVVRSRQPGEAIDVTVIRSDTLEVFKGQFNGTALARAGTTQDQTTPEAGALGNPDASQSGEVFFTAEFESPENWFTFTKLIDTDKYQAYTDNNRLHLFIEPKNVTLYALYDMSLNNANVRVETTAQKVEGPNTNNIGLVCRATDAGWYEFNITNGGEWFIYIFIASEDDPYSILDSGLSQAINLLNKPNQLAATCIGRQLTFIINGVEVASISDNTFSNGGQVGISIFSVFDNLGVEFEYFTATVP